MARKTEPTNKKRETTPAQPAATPRQVALVLPHGSASAGTCFETATELLNCDLTVHKLWQGEK
jgi:hypothetical protein